jgi:hypothetical protein
MNFPFMGGAPAKTDPTTPTVASVTVTTNPPQPTPAAAPAPEANAEAIAKAKAEAVESERKRVSAIQALAAPGFEAKVQELIANGESLEASALALCEAYKAKLMEPPKADAKPTEKDLADAALKAIQSSVPQTPNTMQQADNKICEHYKNIKNPVERAAYFAEHKDQLLKEIPNQTKEA